MGLQTLIFFLKIFQEIIQPIALALGSRNQNNKAAVPHAGTRRAAQEKANRDRLSLD